MVMQSIHTPVATDPKSKYRIYLQDMKDGKE